MTNQTPAPSPTTKLSWPIIGIIILLVGAIIALAFAWNQARQATVQAELALATAAAHQTEAEESAEAGQNSRATTAAATDTPAAQTDTATVAQTDAPAAQADVAAAQAVAATAQAEAAAAQAELAAVQAEVVAAQATAVAAEAAAVTAEASTQAQQAEALAAAASETETQARQAEAYRLAAAAQANLPHNPPYSLLLATEAVSVSQSAGPLIPPEITGALRQAVWANRLGRPLLAGHIGPVNDVAFNPAGRSLASVGDDGAVRLWQTATGGELLTLAHSAAGQPVYSVAFNPSGDRLATAGFDQTAKIWDAQTGQELLTLTGHKNWVVGVAFSPASPKNSPEMIATGSQDGTAKLWDAATGELLFTLTPNSAKTGGLNRLAFSPQGDRLATASDDGPITLWDTATGRAVSTLTGHAGPVYAVAFNPQGDRLASASIDGTVKLWRTDSGKEVRTLRHNRGGWATSVAFSPGGKWLASAGQDGRVVIWDAATGRERFTLTGPTGPVNGLAISPETQGDSAGVERLAAASADGQVWQWQISGDNAVPVLPPLANPRGPVYSLALNPAGEQLAAATGDGAVKIWQVAPDKNRLLRTLAPASPAGAFYTAAFSPQGDTLAAGGEDGTVTVWATTASALAETAADPQLRLTGHTGPVYTLAFNPDGRQLASAGADGSTRLWDTATGEAAAVLSNEEPGPIYALAFNLPGKFLAVAGQTGRVVIWDTATGEPITSLPGDGTAIQTLAFSPTPPVEAEADAPPGGLLAIGGADGSVRLWRGEQLVASLPGTGVAIQTLAFSPDGLRLAATAADGAITVWSLVSGRMLLRLPSPAGVSAGFGLAFLPDGSLVSGGQAANAGEMVLQWAVAADELLNLYSPAPVTGLALAGLSTGNGADRLAAAGADGVVRLWQIEPEAGRWTAAPFGGKRGEAGLFSTGEPAVLTGVAANEAYLAAGDETGSVWLWAVTSGKVFTQVAAHTGPVNSLVLTPASENPKEARLVTAGQDNLVKVWPISATGKINNRPQLTLRGHTGDVVKVAFTPDADGASLLATASHDSTARLWDGESGKELRVLNGHTGWLNDLAFNAGGNYLATAGEDGTVRVWEVASGRELLSLTSAEAPDSPMKRVAFGPAGSAGGERLAALTGDGVILGWSLASGQDEAALSARPLFQLPPLSAGQPDHLAFDASGRALITAGDDGIVRFYALKTEDLLNLR